MRLRSPPRGGDAARSSDDPGSAAVLRVLDSTGRGCGGSAVPSDLEDVES